jgi:hypothetical protein
MDRAYSCVRTSCTTSSTCTIISAAASPSRLNLASSSPCFAKLFNRIEEISATIVESSTNYSVERIRH